MTQYFLKTMVDAVLLFGFSEKPQAEEPKAEPVEVPELPEVPETSEVAAE